MLLNTMETTDARKWRWLIFAVACMETVLFGGILFGWGSLVYVLKEDGVFSHLCPNHDADRNRTLGTQNETSISEQSRQSSKVASQRDKIEVRLNPAFSHRTPYMTHNYTSYTSSDESSPLDAAMPMTSAGWMRCEAQDNMLSLCFSITAVCLFTTTSLAGALSYKFGTMTTRLVGWLCFTVGGLLTAFTSTETPWLLFGGLPPLGFGGVVLLITNIQIGTLFDKGSSTVIATMTGLFDTSSVIMLFLKFAHEAGVGRRESLLVLTGLHALTLVPTLTLMPRSHFTWTSQVTVTEQQLEVTDADCAQDQDAQVQQKSDREDRVTVDALGSRHPTKRKVRSLRACVLSVMFVGEVAWVALLQLRFSYFLASLNPWLLHRLGGNQAEVSHFTNVSLYMMMGGLLVSLVSGAVFDFFKHIFANHPVLERRQLYPPVAMLSITSGLGLGMSVLVLLPGDRSLYVTFLFTALLRSFLYSVDASVVTLIFPPQYFAALFSVSDFVGGAVSMLQYALFVWHEAAGFTVVNYTLAVVVAATFLHPVVQILRGLHTGKTVTENDDTAPEETMLYGCTTTDINIKI